MKKILFQLTINSYCSCNHLFTNDIARIPTFRERRGRPDLKMKQRNASFKMPYIHWIFRYFLISNSHQCIDVKLIMLMRRRQSHLLKFDSEFLSEIACTRGYVTHHEIDIYGRDIEWRWVVVVEYRVCCLGRKLVEVKQSKVWKVPSPYEKFPLRIEMAKKYILTFSKTFLQTLSLKLYVGLDGVVKEQGPCTPVEDWQITGCANIGLTKDESLYDLRVKMILVVVVTLDSLATGLGDSITVLAEEAADAGGIELAANWELWGDSEKDELGADEDWTTLALTVTFSCLYEIPVARNDGPWKKSST